MTDPTDIGNLLQGGGLLAFAAAVWYQVRQSNQTLTRVQEMLASSAEHLQVLPRVLELLARLEERLLPLELAPDQSGRRRRVRTDPRGVPRVSETEETEPGGRRGR